MFPHSSRLVMIYTTLAGTSNLGEMTNHLFSELQYNFRNVPEHRHEQNITLHTNEESLCFTPLLQKPPI